MSEKHKDKEKKRKENGEDDKEKKKHKKQEKDSDDDKKVESKKDKKEKKKEKKDKEKDKDNGKAKSAAGASTNPSDAFKMGVPKPISTPGQSKFSDVPPPGYVEKPAEKQAEAPQKSMKSWQDDELEVDSGDEAAGQTKLQTLSSVAAKSLGQSSGDAHVADDSLDAYMLDIAKTNEKNRKEKSTDDSSAVDQGMAEGISVMDASRVKTITLEEIMALGATPSSSSNSKPQKDSATDAPPASGAAKAAPAAATAEPSAEGDKADSEDSEDAAFHAAFMAQMKALREGKVVEEVEIDDGSDTCEEWDDDRKAREKKRQEKRQARWKAQDERRAERRKAREAKRAENGEPDAGDDDDSEEDSEEEKEEKPQHKQVQIWKPPSQLQAATNDVSAEAQGQGNAELEKQLKGLPKKEQRRLRREHKLKQAGEDNKKKMPAGMQETEILHSDAEASENSEMEEAAESYFDLVKRYTTKKTLPQVDHDSVNYHEYTKNLYVQVKEITAMKDHEVEDFRRTHGEIRVRGKNCPRPIKNFLQCGLPQKLLKILESRDCTVPFPIQMQAIPTLMCGRDLIGVAQTGSGKTMAYLLPMMRHCMAQLSGRTKGGWGDDGPMGFIIAPTRELSLQIHREASVMCKACGMFSVCAYGGGPMGEQLSALKKGCEILIGTPGRLIDVLTTSNGKITHLRNVTFLVLDEADRMFDMGFEPQIGMFLQSTRPDKQVAMLSATLPTHVEALARQCLKKPIEITVGERNTAAVNISQFIEVMDEGQKFYRLLQLLGEWHDHGAVIIFVHQQKDVDEMFTELLKFGYPALALHGGQDQCDRDFTVQDFKDGVANILVATSVAARGLDVKKVILVVNFKVPDHLEDYIHRIGRTGRAGKAGFAYTFIQPDEGDRAQDMLDALRQCGQTVPEKLKRLCEDYQGQINRGEAKKRRKWGGFGGKGFKYDNTEKSQQQKDRLKAKKDELIGDDNGSDEEEFKDAWNDDKPLAAAARKDKEKDKEKEEKEAEYQKKKNPPADSSTPKTTGEAAAAIAAKLVAEAEAASKAKLGVALAGTPAADAPAASPLGAAGKASLVAPSVPGVAAPKGPAKHLKSEEDIDAEAQAKAEEVLKNLSEELREQKLPKLKESIKAKLMKANEVAAVTVRPGPPMPPPPPAEESPLLKATLAVPNIIPINAPGMGAESMVSRAMMQIQEGIVEGPAKRAAEAEAMAAHLTSSFGSQVAPGMHKEEVDINDYPEIVRKRVTSREPLLNIEEIAGAGVKINVRGQYFANPSKMPEGCRTLYVEIMGPTASSVQKARSEVTKMAEALAIRTLNIPGLSNAVRGKPGWYDPAVGK